jgi:hypothetical protein
VREKHIIDQGDLLILDYMAEKKMDVTKRLSDSAVKMNAQFKYESDNAVPIQEAKLEAVADQLAATEKVLAGEQAKLDELKGK